MKSLIAVMLILVCAQQASSYEINTGAVYQIGERDALEEVQERAKAVDWKKHIQAVKPKNYRPATLTSLPRARRSKTFLVDMSYTFENDVFDSRGNLVYPKGYIINPLEHIKYNKTVIVINGEDKIQVQWLRRNKILNDLNTTILLTHGDVITISRMLNRPVHYATIPLVARFGLQYVPSVVKASGLNMQVSEINIQEN